MINREMLRKLRDAKGWSQVALAERAGVSQQLIAGLETGQFKSTTKLGLIAGALGVGPGEIDPDYDAGLPPPRPRPKPEHSQAFEVVFSRRELPVYGRAMGGKDGRFLFNGERIGTFRAPRSLEDVEEAYGVIIDGVSMIPRYEPGELVQVNPRKPYRRGDYVCVQLRGEPGEPPIGLIKRFVGFTARELTLEQLNPPDEDERIMRFPASEVVSIHRVVGSGDPD